MPICKQTGESFSIDSEDRRMLELLSPVVGGKKFELPLPTLSPSARFQRRAAHRNERNLFRRNCAKSGQSVISIFNEEKSFPVYAHTVWWGDEWDPKSYGREFDFSQSFFEQFVELRDSVPRLPLLAKDSVNCDYTNHAANNKDSYLTTVLFNSEDVHYSRKIYQSRAVFDCCYVMPDGGELLYECFWVNKLYDSMFSVFCSGSSGLLFCLDCRGCNDCFMSVGLRNQSFVFRNEQLTKDEYRRRVTALNVGRYHELLHLKNEFKSLWLKATHPALRQDSCENVLGDYIIAAKDCIECFLSVGGENCRYCIEFDTSVGNSRSLNCMDCFGFGASELLYEVQAQASGYRNVFCNWSYNVSNSLYLDMCFNISNCFGCVGLHAHEQHCILNKQYSKTEYEKLVGKIIEHMRVTREWGEFFPVGSSIFGYNETIAMEFFPLSQAEAATNGFRWSSYEPPAPTTSGEIRAQDIPDDVRDVDDSILQASIRCERTGRPFRLTKRELEFYRQQKIALPRLHFDERHTDRLAFRNPPKLFKRKCAVSGVEIVTSFAPERPEIVVSNDVYLKRLYG